MNKFSKIKIYVIFAAVFFGVLFFAKVSWATVFVNEEFEDNAFNPPYKYACDIPEPAGCQNTVRYTTAQARSGSYSLEGNFIQAGAAGIMIHPADYGRADFGSDSYLRFYIKFDSNFRFYHRYKAFRWHKSGNNPYININGVSSDGTGKDIAGTRYGDISVYFTGSCLPGGVGGFWYVSDEMASKGQNQADWVVEAGDGWWMIEVHYSIANGTVDLWVMRPGDALPTKVFDNKSLAGCLSAGAFDTVDMNWINDVGEGSGGMNWFDEIVIADSYIGPVGGGTPPDTTPPAAPTGVRVS